MSDTQLPPTRTYDQVQADLAKQRASLGQTTTDISNIQNQYSSANDPEINALRNQHADKVKQLFDYDSKLAPVYFQPEAAPAAPGETVEQPGQRIIDPLIGMRSASTQTQATASELADILSRIGKRKDTLTENMDKALTLFKYGLQIKQMEMDSLEKELDRIEKKSSSGKGASDLTALLNAITGVQAKTPRKTGKAKDKTELMKIAKQYGGEIDYQQNKDGTYSWAARRQNQEFVTPEEYEDVPALIKKLGAATVAGGNASSSEVDSIIEKFLPEKEIDITRIKKDLVSDFAESKARNIPRDEFVRMALISYGDDLGTEMVNNIIEELWPTPKKEETSTTSKNPLEVIGNKMYENKKQYGGYWL